MSYFKLRKNDVDEYATYIKPQAVISQLKKGESILDYGFGRGYLLRALREEGFTNLSGCEVDKDCLKNKQLKGINLIDLNQSQIEQRYDVIILSHVLEHIKKGEVVDFLKSLKKLLKKDGKLIVSTPNAQSTTGVYWLYADFTHEYIYTTGSLFYVLTAAGYTKVEFIKKTNSLFSLLLPILRKVIGIMNKISNSFYDHRFENIYSFELLAICYNDE
jgi:2-polyprenyl-3-methyl-5-hydroxy-6-metoxy-1,4-benzoquinol methylase